MKHVTQTYDLTPKPEDRLDALLDRFEEVIEKLEFITSEVEGEA